MKPIGPNEKDIFSTQPYEALETMMSLYGTTVLRTAYFYVNDRHLAEDISQEVFLRAYKNWLKFRWNSKVKTWLTTITVHVCRDKLARKMSLEQPTDPHLLELNRTISVEEEALEKLKKSIIMEHILQLPMHYQEVLYLYYYVELNTREIAEAIGAPEGTVRGRLHRAREQLGRVLEQEEMNHG